MKRQLTVVAVVAILALACAEAEDPSTSEFTASPTTTNLSTLAVPPEVTSPPWPTPPHDLAQRIAACFDPEANAPQLETALEGCPGLQEFSANAIVAEGEVPFVLLDVGGGCTHYLESYVLWRQGETWRVQSVESLLPNGRDFGTTLAGAWPYRPDGSKAGGPTARVVEDGTIVRLGAVIGQANCGSGPHATYVLLSLTEGEWTLSWDGKTAFAGLIGQTSVEFSDKELDTIAVRGTSFGRSDAKSGIFSEHKLAPNRHFEQLWTRHGEQYALVEERVIPSAINTLLEFIYRLSSGDEAGVATLVTEQSLVSVARNRGLEKSPDEPSWTAWCGQTGESVLPCVVVRPDGSGVRVRMVPVAGDWLISGIEPCIYRDDAQGRRCD